MRTYTIKWYRNPIQIYHVVNYDYVVDRTGVPIDKLNKVWAHLDGMPKRIGTISFGAHQRRVIFDKREIDAWLDNQPQSTTCVISAV